jgi:hypothetical protein
MRLSDLHWIDGVVSRERATGGPHLWPRNRHEAGRRG